MKFLPDELYAQVERSIPLICVDFVPVRQVEGRTEIGLILRESPFGQVWCHLGGRISRGETITDALQRHARDTLDTDLVLGADPQPSHVYQWFPPADTPESTQQLAHGVDPRKHSVGLSFTVELAGEPSPRNEALDFSWFGPAELPDPLWPGCQDLLYSLLRS